MMFKSILLSLSLGMAACAQGHGGSSGTQPPPPSQGGSQDQGTSSIKLVSADAYLLTQNESKSQVIVPSQIHGTVEVTLKGCFDSVGSGYFKDPQGQTFPFTMFGISLRGEARGTQGCKDTFVVDLPVMQEITGTINFEYVQSAQKKTFSRPFSVVAKETIAFDGGNPPDTGHTGTDDSVEDGKCGGTCETLIASFMEKHIDKETRIFTDVFGRNETASVFFTGTAQKGEFSVRSGLFAFESGTYAIQGKRLVLTKNGGTETLEFAYLPIKDNGQPNPTPTLYAKEKAGINKTSYYIW